MGINGISPRRRGSIDLEVDGGLLQVSYVWYRVRKSGILGIMTVRV